MLRSLVGSEMCIRDSFGTAAPLSTTSTGDNVASTSPAADDNDPFGNAVLLPTTSTGDNFSAADNVEFTTSVSTSSTGGQTATSHPMQSVQHHQADMEQLEAIEQERSRSESNQSTLQALHDQIDHAGADVTRLDQQLEAEQRRNAELQTQIDKARHDLERLEAEKTAKRSAHLTESQRSGSSEQQLQQLELNIEEAQLAREAACSRAEVEAAELREAEAVSSESESLLESLRAEVLELEASTEQMRQEKAAQVKALEEQQHKISGLEADKRTREQTLNKAKAEHVDRKREFTDNLLKLRAEIAGQKAVVAGQKKEHAQIQHEKEQLRKELAAVNQELKRLNKHSSDMDYAINNDRFGLMQQKSDLQVAREKLAEAQDESEFSGTTPAKYNPSTGFDFNDDDNDDLHADFTDLMPETPDQFGGGQDYGTGGGDFEHVNFDIPANVDRTLFDADLASEDEYDDGGDDAQSGSWGGATADAWDAFDVPRDPSPNPRARGRGQSNKAIPRIPIEQIPAEAEAPRAGDKYNPFGQSPVQEDEYQPF
eukprot:TRINITY_DN5324_c0_g1_i3.p1 TRINITY_DN5324_c0_g1~~TRINITY_DN5324_c0_g1_i3.p1  ORF type:complete len:542 (+),score=197.04 TRINITY_DN5324_c0_g1_i3:167-1792(+)